MSKPVQECLLIIEAAEKDINQLLTGTEFVHQLLEINHLLRRLKTRFTFMGAVTNETNGETKPQFPPITDFMGEKIEPVKKIDKAELNPKAAEVQKFKEEVTKLYDQIRDLQPSQVINAYTLPEHLLIVRGVAKWAGLENYETADITPKFIEEIQAAIKAKIEDEQKQAERDKAAGKPQPESRILTQADIDGDAELQKWKAKPGEELVTKPDGKRFIKRQK